MQRKTMLTIPFHELPMVVDVTVVIVQIEISGFDQMDSFISIPLAAGAKEKFDLRSEEGRITICCQAGVFPSYLVKLLEFMTGFVFALSVLSKVAG